MQTAIILFTILLTPSINMWPHVTGFVLFLKWLSLFKLMMRPQVRQLWHRISNFDTIQIVKLGLSYELCSPFALAMWPLQQVHFALMCSISWLSFLKFVRFSSHVERKTMKLNLLYKNVDTSSHKKGTLVALTIADRFELWLKVRDVSSKLSLPRQGPWKLVWVKQVFKLSEVELSEFHCIRG